MENKPTYAQLQAARAEALRLRAEADRLKPTTPYGAWTQYNQANESARRAENRRDDIQRRYNS